MKKRFFTAAIAACLFLFSISMHAQDPKCDGLKVDLANAEKKLEQLQKTKIPMEEFFNLMEEPSTTSAINDEISFCEQAIKKLQSQIAAGDKSPETAASLQSYRDRIELMILKMSKDYNENTFYKLPKYRALQKTMSNMSQQELDMKRDTAALGAELRVRKCPGLNNPNKDDITDMLETDWGGKWKGITPEASNFILAFNGAGNSTTGTLKYIPLPDEKGIDIAYQVKNCTEKGSKLSCSYYSTFEDYEKYMDVKGTVEFNITDNTISSAWKEVSTNVRWKPGRERAYQKLPLRSFEIDFKKE